MEKITLKKFAQLIENNKSHFLGSMGWNVELNSTINIINKHSHELVKTYTRTAKVSASKIITFTYNKDGKINHSRLDLSGNVYIYPNKHLGNIYINISNDNNTCLYIIENN